MKNALTQLQAGQRWFKTADGLWIKVLAIGLGTLGIMHLSVNGMTKLQKNIYRINQRRVKMNTDMMEKIMIAVGQHENNADVETALLPNNEFFNLIA
jgi:hypothetical protein